MYVFHSLYIDVMGHSNRFIQSALCKGEISLTCDAWQSDSADGYFAVTGHWIEEDPNRPGVWKLKHGLLGFTQLNTAHDGVHLGQALFKICERLGITHKVFNPTT